MSAESIGNLSGRIVNRVAEETGRVKQFPARENEMNQLATVEGRTPMDLLSQAIERGAGLDVISQFMDLQERWEKNQARKAFDAAMAEAKAEIPIIVKNRHVGFDSRKPGASRTDYMHEDLAEIARTIDPILTQHGLSYRFKTSSAPNEPITVTCVVSHRLGHSEENTLQGPRDESGNKNGIQAIGSTITYLQRYSLKAALGLAASTDDDGETSGDGEAITEEQATNLRDIAAEVGADIPRFCKYMKVESLPDILAKDYDRAIAALQAKRAKA